MTAAALPLLQLQGVVKHYPVRGGLFRQSTRAVRAVDGVDLVLHAGETLGLVGESGCGKSTLGRLALRLIEASAGRVIFDGTDLAMLDAAALRQRRRALQIIFQDPYSSLNPRMTVGQTLAEPLALHGLHTGRHPERVAELLHTVGLAPQHALRYPHEFSGGQRQRIGIARALAVEPQLIVCDEAVSALDVSVQAQVVNLLQDLQQRLGLAYLFIAHDLAVVKHIADRVAVMYLGRIVEIADKHSLFAAPRHPYTQALLAAIPVPDPGSRHTAARQVLGGDVPSPVNPPSGCHFHTRCPHARALCAQESPVLQAEAEVTVVPAGAGTGPAAQAQTPAHRQPSERLPASTGSTPHAVACHFWRELPAASLPGQRAAMTPMRERLEWLQQAFVNPAPDPT
jgi:oligopeptide/dipeptide ABC transporter ATP-binding protein